jgi:hypothetical protein
VNSFGILTTGVLLLAVLVSTVIAYFAGRDGAERRYQADLATSRSAFRRQGKDLEDARAETAMLRRILRDNGVKP